MGGDIVDTGGDNPSRPPAPTATDSPPGGDRAAQLMARRPHGSLKVRLLADGTRAYLLRFSVDGERASETLHERPGCDCGCGGGWSEPRAAHELQNILARAAAGVWRPRRAYEHATARGRAPTFHEYASSWFARWTGGEFGNPPDRATRALAEQWTLPKYLLPGLAKVVVDDEHLDKTAVAAFKASLLADRDEIAKVAAAGRALRRDNGTRIRPLSNRSIQIILRLLGQICEQAVEDGHLTRNPARGRHVTVAVPRSRRTWLELDELADLLDAAGAIDAGYSQTTDAVLALHEEGLAIPEISARLGKAESTVYYHLAKPPPEAAGELRSFLTTLGYTGMRIGEVLAVRHRDMRLHADPMRIDVPDAKTESGIREVHVSPELRAVLVAHCAQRRRAGLPSGEHDPVWGGPDGLPHTPTWARKKLARAVRLADERRAARGLPRLPDKVTPHTLRHTYISIALIATKGDTAWVQDQVGHADPETTNRIYRHVIRRRDGHGPAFDGLVAQARNHVAEAAGGGPNVD